MEPSNIDQLVKHGLIPTFYSSVYSVKYLFDTKDISLENASSSSPSSLTYHELFVSSGTFPQSFLAHQKVQFILQHSSFTNKNLTVLLESALRSDIELFRQTLRDFKIVHKKLFDEEINQTDKHQHTLVWYLAVADLYSCIQELYYITHHRLNINVKNGYFGLTVLHYAILNGKMEDIQLLLKTGVNVNLCDNFGRTALHYIGFYSTKCANHIEMAKLLVDYGAQPNLTDVSDRTILHYSILHENFDLVEYLIQLKDSGVLLRDKQGHNSLCYLCQHILNLNDLENNQCQHILQRLLKIIDFIIDRSSFNELLNNFHVINGSELGENLLLEIYMKFLNYQIPTSLDRLFHRFKSIIFGNDRNHHLHVERLIRIRSWTSVVNALCNTHNVNISKGLLQFIVVDPHTVLNNVPLPSHEFSIVFILIFYALATNRTLLQNIVPVNKSIFNNQQNQCQVKNYELHTTYASFIFSCLYDASFNVYSLKHLCRSKIRNRLKIEIIEKIVACTCLSQELQEYIQFGEIRKIYFEATNLSSIVLLIQRLVENILRIVDENQQSNLSLSINSVADQEDLQINSYEPETIIKIDDIKYSNRQIIEKIMAESDTSIEHFNFNIDQELSKNSSEKSLNSSADNSNFVLETDPKSMSLFTETELENINVRTKNIQELIDTYLLKTDMKK